MTHYNRSFTKEDGLPVLNGFDMSRGVIHLTGHFNIEKPVPAGVNLCVYGSIHALNGVGENSGIIVKKYHGEYFQDGRFDYRNGSMMIAGTVENNVSLHAENTIGLEFAKDFLSASAGRKIDAFEIGDDANLTAGVNITTMGPVGERAKIRSHSSLSINGELGKNGDVISVWHMSIGAVGDQSILISAAGRNALLPENARNITYPMQDVLRLMQS